MSTTFTDPTDQATITIEELEPWITENHAADGNSVHFKISARDDDDQTVTIFLSNTDRASVALAALGEAGSLADAGWLASTQVLIDSERHSEGTLLELARRCLEAANSRNAVRIAQERAEAERKAKIKAVEVAIGQRPLNLAQPLAPQLVERGIVAA